MKKVIVTAKSVDAAVEEALSRLSATWDQVRISVLEEPSKGFLGLFGAKDAKVEVELVRTPLDDARQFLRDVTHAMGVNVELEAVEKQDHVRLQFSGQQLGMLIGRRGQTLDALQYLTNIVANKHHQEYTRFVLDAEGYRDRRKSTLQDLADRIAKQVLRTGKPVTLDPMNPMERKVIHTQIQRYDRLVTYSQGDEPQRRVVVSLKK
ncbi:DNA-binding protein [Marinithermofilum abyssi]|uniref:RNA-binding protein KhpB n=1 Tax=Marinithermofilum abyssi TaxID=1571185 RepID=A0A8J2VCE6_9BACL|nr:DNA-binding protein [Marinithermofilum abyssi]